MRKKGSFGKRPPKAKFPPYVTREVGLATGGVVSAPGPAAAASTGSPGTAGATPAGVRAARARGGSCAPMQGATAMRRLDRPGRRRGGAVGADSSPLTSAHNLSGGTGDKV